MTFSATIEMYMYLITVYLTVLQLINSFFSVDLIPWVFFPLILRSSLSSGMHMVLLNATPNESRMTATSFYKPSVLPRLPVHSRAPSTDMPFMKHGPAVNISLLIVCTFVQSGTAVPKQ